MSGLALAVFPMTTLTATEVAVAIGNVCSQGEKLRNLLQTLLQCPLAMWYGYPDLFTYKSHLLVEMPNIPLGN